MSFTKDNINDNYATNKKGWEIIKQYIPIDKKIWSPFYCDGKQKEYFKELGFDIIHEDEYFFKNNKGDIIIDNPPFSKFKDVCIRLKELDKPDQLQHHHHRHHKLQLRNQQDHHYSHHQLPQHHNPQHQ